MILISTKNENKKLFRGFNTFVILFTILLIVSLLTYVLPAGKYEMVEDPNTGRQVVDPNSFQYVDRNPVKIFNIFKSIPKGMSAASNIIFFIFIISGAIQIIRATGAIDAGIVSLVNSMSGREKLILPILMVIFSLTGAFLGFSEENLVFIPLVIALVKQLGYDSVVAICVSYLACQVGFMAAMMNPFNVGVAQGIAQLPLYSGIEFRFVIWIIFLLVTAWYVLSYAEKVKANPSLSIVAGVSESEDSSVPTTSINFDIKLEGYHKLIYAVFVLGIIWMIYGVYKYGWGMQDIAAAFLIIGIISGFIGKLTPSKIAQEFINGAQGIVSGALVVGVARAIYIVMSESFIIDPMIHSLVGVIKTLPSSIAVVGMYMIQWVMNILITSSTGLAAISMPIMVPIADLLDINRQVAVLAFLFGDNINGSILPTSSTLLAALSFANIPYTHWFKFLYKLTIIWTIMAAIILIIANAINYGPF